MNNEIVIEIREVGPFDENPSLEMFYRGEAIEGGDGDHIATPQEEILAFRLMWDSPEPSTHLRSARDVMEAAKPNNGVYWLTETKELKERASLFDPRILRLVDEFAFSTKTSIKRYLAQHHGIDDLKAVTKYGETLLMDACYWRNTEVAALLIAVLDYEDLIFRNKYRCTPLHYACWMGCKDTVKLLLDRLKPEDRNPVNMYNCTPLHYACRRGWESIVCLLLDHLPNAAFRRGGGIRAIAEARRRGFDRVANHVEDYMIDVLQARVQEPVDTKCSCRIL